jgi:hypothetical protein
MEKIKQFIDQAIGSEKGKDILVVIIVILVGLGSFELGRLSKQNTSSGIKIEYPAEVTSQSANVISAIGSAPKMAPSIKELTSGTGKKFFASNRGTKYYSLGCSAGKSLKQENRVYFNTKEEAEKAGYELSSSCK